MKWGTAETTFDEIHFAARSRDADTVRQLIATGGVHVDSLNGRAPNGDGGNTALWFAAQGAAKGGKEVARCLLELGANVNLQCEHGALPSCNRFNNAPRLRVFNHSLSKD